MTNAATPEGLTVKASIVRNGSYVFLGACLLLASVLVLTQPVPYAENPVVMKVFMGYLGLPFSLAVIGLNAYTMVRRRNAIVINAEGIADNTGWLAPGLVPWDQVQEVYLLKLKDDHYLCVQPVDAAAWMAALPRHKRRLAQANIDVGYAPIRIQFKKASSTVVAEDGMAACKALHPEKIGRVRKPRY